MSALSTEQIQSFRNFGYTKLSGIFNKDLEPAKKRIEVLLDSSASKVFVRWGKDHHTAFYKIPQITTDPAFERLANSPRLKAAVQELVGPAEIFRDVVVGKPPRTGSTIRYHQDAVYWDAHDPDQILSAWIALDDSPLEAGCLQFIPGSHRSPVQHDMFLGNHPLPRILARMLRSAVSLTGTGDNPKTISQRIFFKIKTAILGSATRVIPSLNDLNEISVDRSNLPVEKEVCVPAQAGDVILFHSQLLHASGANTSDKPRRAYIVTYVGSSPSGPS